MKAINKKKLFWLGALIITILAFISLAIVNTSFAEETGAENQDYNASNVKLNFNIQGDSARFYDITNEVDLDITSGLSIPYSSCYIQVTDSDLVFGIHDNLESPNYEQRIICFPNYDKNIVSWTLDDSSTITGEWKLITGEHTITINTVNKTEFSVYGRLASDKTLDYSSLNLCYKTYDGSYTVESDDMNFNEYGEFYFSVPSAKEAIGYFYGVNNGFSDIFACLNQFSYDYALAAKKQKILIK